jgi:hypothetical protein
MAEVNQEKINNKETKNQVVETKKVPESNEREIETFSMTYPDGSIKTYAKLRGGAEIEVMGPVDSKNFVETKSQLIERREQETTESLGQEPDLNIIEQESRKTIDKSREEAEFMRLFHNLIIENQGEMLAIKEGEHTQLSSEILGGKIRKLFSDRKTIKELQDSELGFVLLGEQQEPEYTFLYSIEEETDDKSEDNQEQEEIADKSEDKENQEK